MWVCVCAHGHICTCICAYGSEVNIWYLHLLSAPYFWERFSPWTRISWIQLDWLAFECTERASDFHLPKIRLTSAHSHVWHLMWMLGNGVWVITLANWTAFLAPIIIYINCWGMSQICSGRLWRCDSWAVGVSVGNSVNKVIFVKNRGQKTTCGVQFSSFYHVDLQGLTQVVRLHGKCLCLLSHLTSTDIKIFHQ